MKGAQRLSVNTTCCHAFSGWWPWSETKVQPCQTYKYGRKNSSWHKNVGARRTWLPQLKFKPHYYFFPPLSAKNTSQIAIIWIQANLFSRSLSHTKVQCHNVIPQRFFSNCDLEWWWNCWQMVVLHFKTVSVCNTKEVTAPGELRGQVAWETPPAPLEPACQNSAEAEKMSCDQYF